MTDAELSAKFGLHQEVGLKNLMHDAVFFLERHQNQLFSSFVTQLWNDKPSSVNVVVDKAIATFAHSELYPFIKQAVSGMNNPETAKQGYLVGLLTWLLLQNSKAVQESFVNHPTVFTDMMSGLVKTKVGEPYLAAFQRAIEHSQAHYDQLRATSRPTVALS